jgi:rhodanese-related sulfurtransferase
VSLPQRLCSSYSFLTSAVTLPALAVKTSIAAFRLQLCLHFTVPDRTTELVVYDATGSKKAALLARERLLLAGYRNVAVLEGGLSAWRSGDTVL